MRKPQPPPPQFVVGPAAATAQTETGGEDVELHEFITKERAACMPEADQLRVYRRYARGKQPIKLTDLQKEVVGRVIGNRFCDNVVSMVLDTISSRLRFERFTVSDSDTGAAKKALSWLDTVRQKNRWSDLANKTHWAMLRDGDCAICIGWKPGDTQGQGRPLVTREPFWDGLKGTWIAYERDGQTIAYAVKDWVDPDGTVRRTLFYPDRIYRWAKFASGAGKPAPNFGAQGWVRIVDPSDPIYEVQDLEGNTVSVQWPALWLDVAGKPLGVPFVHFANPYIPNDGDTADDDDTDVGKTQQSVQGDYHPSYGVSECANGLIGQQDHLNATHLDIAVARKTTAAQIYWGTGIETEDENGKPIAFKPRAGKLLASENDEAKFGVLPAGDLNALISSVDVTLRAVSRTTKVPMHTFTGDWPSGAAMYQSESGLNFKCERIAEATGPHWGSVAFWCLKLANTFGGERFDLEKMIGSEFSPVSRLDPMVLAEVANSLAEHISEKEYLRLVGYSEEKIASILKEREDERQANLNYETALAEATARRFNRAPTTPPNTPPPVPSPPPGPAN